MNNNKLFCIIIFSFIIIPNIIFAQDNSCNFQEVVVQHQVKRLPNKKREFTQSEIKEIKIAKEIVKTYWISSYKEVYNLLSKDYKESLKNIQQISNGEEYEKAFPETERVWIKQTYQRVDMPSKDFIQITVLSEWDEEGYEGVMTYIFNLVKEDGKWKISHIMF